jgi:hypothetical protein
VALCALSIRLGLCRHQWIVNDTAQLYISYILFRFRQCRVGGSYGIVRVLTQGASNAAPHIPVDARALHAPALCRAEDGRETNGLCGDSKGVMPLWPPEVVRLWCQRWNAKFETKERKGGTKLIIECCTKHKAQCLLRNRLSNALDAAEGRMRCTKLAVECAARCAERSSGPNAWRKTEG